MTAQLLRLINSAYFGLCSEVSDPKRAVNLLGLSTISTLVLNLHIFQSFDEDQIHRAELGGIWSHGLLTARCAKEIARSESDDQLQIDESFSAGLLHDTGRLILAVNASAEYLQARDKAADGGTTLSEAEEEHVGVNHAHFGAYLMNLWGLPSSVVEAIAYHHTPSESPTSGFKPLVAVHVANAIATELQPPSWGSRDSRIDGDFLRQAGLADRVSVWRELCENALELEGAAQ
jgi:HD-like signal output (HDOD) protein